MNKEKLENVEEDITSSTTEEKNANLSPEEWIKKVRDEIIPDINFGHGD